MFCFESEQLVDLRIRQRVHRVAFAQIGDDGEARSDLGPLLGNRVDAGLVGVGNSQGQLFVCSALWFAEPGLRPIRPQDLVALAQVLRSPADRFAGDAVEAGRRAFDQVRERPMNERLERQIRREVAPFLVNGRCQKQHFAFADLLAEQGGTAVVKSHQHIARILEILRVRFDHADAAKNERIAQLQKRVVRR